MHGEIEAIHQGLRRDGAIVSYSGPFSQEINEEVCDALDAFMKKHQVSDGFQEKLFSIFVEMSQNIRRYVGDKRTDAPVFNRIYDSGAIVVGHTETGYHVSSVNLMENRDVPELVSHLEQVKRLSPEAMKKAYRDGLRERVGRGKSPGLGFLAIAKKTVGNFDFRIEAYDGGLSFFYFNAELQASKGPSHE